MSETIAPCPACQDARGYVEDDSNDERKAFWVVCGGEWDCAVIGPTRATPADAIAAWNRLSRAAALLRACDAFTGRVRVLPDAFAPGYWFAIHTDRQFTSRAPGQTHTDALIALGDLIGALPANKEG